MLGLPGGSHRSSFLLTLPDIAELRVRGRSGARLRPVVYRRATLAGDGNGDRKHAADQVEAVMERTGGDMGWNGGRKRDREISRVRTGVVSPVASANEVAPRLFRATPAIRIRAQNWKKTPKKDRPTEEPDRPSLVSIRSATM